jgi:hypothetical protein
MRSARWRKPCRISTRMASTVPRSKFEPRHFNCFHK